MRIVVRMLVCMSVWTAIGCERANALDPTQHISQYQHTAWNVQDGWLPANPESLAQGRDGYLWLGLPSGLIRFDGMRFTPWTSELNETLASNQITAMLATEDGSLWIGSEEGLDRLHEGRLTRISDEPSTIWRLHAGKDGSIWAVRSGAWPSERSLCRVVPGKRMQCPPALAGLELTGSTCCAAGFLERADGSLWLGGDVAITRWQTGTTTVLRPASLESNQGQGGVMAIAETRDGDLWIGMGNAGREGGLQRFSNGALRPFISAGFDSSTLAVSTLLIDRQQALWVGTFDQGILRIFGDRVERFRTSDGLSSDTVLQIFEDRENNVWIATTKGLDRFRELKVLTYTTREGLRSNQVGSVLPRKDGSIWIGTARGAQVLRNGAITTQTLPEQVRDDQITSMLEDEAGRTWIGFDQAMLVLESGRTTSIVDSEGRAPGMVSGMAQDLQRNVWLQTGTPSRRLLRLEGARIRETYSEAKLPAARKVAADPFGGIWLGLMSGDLAHLDAGNLQTISFAHVNPKIKARLITQLSVQDDGAVLAAAQYGFIESHRGKQRALTAANGLPCNRVFSFVFDATNALWLYLECGLARVEQEELVAWRADPTRRVSFRLFDALDGARPGWAPFTQEAARSPDGRLWFASINGLQVIDPARSRIRGIAPPVHIEAILADRKSYNVRSQVVLPALTRDIELAYTAPSLGMAQKIAFRYRLEGHDAQWVEVGARRQAFFNDLPPGNYRFQVTACTEDGACNEQGASLAFVLLPAFYQTTWFFVVTTFAALALLWGLFTWRLHQVAGRLRARLDERERIARELHDTFLQSVQGLMLRFHSVMEMLPSAEPAHIEMEQALERADAVIVEGRDRVKHLRNAADGALGLRDTLQDAAARLCSERAPNIRVIENGQPRALHPIVREEVERIAMEALENAVRHAEARTINVEVLYERRFLRLIVRDDGRGIEKSVIESGREGHFGLVGMRERARRIRGRFTISSSPGEGTKVSLVVPANMAFARGWPWRRSS